MPVYIPIHQMQTIRISMHTKKRKGIVIKIDRSKRKNNEEKIGCTLVPVTPVHDRLL
jgi:hypothetical protein